MASMMVHFTNVYKKAFWLKCISFTFGNLMILRIKAIEQSWKWSFEVTLKGSCFGTSMSWRNGGYLIVLLSGIWSKKGVECGVVIETTAYGIFFSLDGGVRSFPVTIFYNESLKTIIVLLLLLELYLWWWLPEMKIWKFHYSWQFIYVSRCRCCEHQVKEAKPELWSVIWSANCDLQNQASLLHVHCSRNANPK